MFRFWLIVFAFISAEPWIGWTQQVRGVVVDVTGAAVGGATVRLLKSVSEEVAHVTGTDSGQFQLGSVGPGSYVLTAWQRGFRSRRVTVVLRQEGEALDLGHIRLDLAGCDAPGVICDWFGEAPPPDPVVSRSDLQIRTDCMAAFATSIVFCSGDRMGRSEADADIRLTRDGSGVYLTAMNGALLSEPDLPRGDCRDAYPKEKQIRIDGRGPGDDICLHTHDRHWSHVFFTDAVDRASQQIAFWQITRKR
jgi:hypothetical protein